ncbi:MAG: hypothetical protein J3R72DRAFT_439819 [Linnemannia gamsii]|nr:MAG: hypothetical protein J3R72DRAFT_439819 [Linnemannia gamsii]
MAHRHAQQSNGVPDNSILCKQGVINSTSTFDSNASPDQTMEDLPPTSYGLPSPIIGGRFIGITGPTHIGIAPGTNGQALHLEVASLSRTRSLKDCRTWVAHKIDVEWDTVKVGNQQFYQHDRHDALTIRKVFSIHEGIRFYLNNFYHDRSESTLNFLLTFFLNENQDLFASILSSVTLFRCVVPVFDTVPVFDILDQENMVVLEQIVVEFFWFPLAEQWKYRARSAVVDNSRPWFMSLAVGPEEPDVTFPDNYVPEDHVPDDHAPDDLVLGTLVTNDHNTMSMDGIVVPLSVAHLPDTMPINDTKAQPVQVQSVQIQHIAAPALTNSTSSTVLPMSISCTQLLLPAIHPNSTHEHGSSCSFTATHGNGDSLPNTAHEPSGGSAESSTTNSHQRPEPQPEPESEPVPRLEHAPRITCTFPGCKKLFTKTGNMKVHRKKHDGVKFLCRHPPCSNNFTQDTDRIRHERVKHLGWRWECAYCSKEFTRQSNANRHPCPDANGRNLDINFQKSL